MSQTELTASAPKRSFTDRLSGLPGTVGSFLTRDRRPRTVYFAAFFMPFLMISVLWACYGVWPFGSKMILAHDQWHQYYPFYLELRTRLKEGGSLLHTWTIGMGTPYLPLFAYYLASPMNLLAVLLPESLVMPYYTLTVLLKITLAGLFCAIFLQKTFRRPNLMIPFFSTAYALCAYIMGYYWNAIWLDTVALLPLVTLGAFSLMRDRRYLLYTISLTLAIFCNYYIGFFVCIFVFLLFVCYNVVNWDDLGGFFSRLWRIALFSLLAIGMTAVITIPTYLGLQSTSAADSKFPDRYALNMTDKPSSHKRVDAKTLSPDGDGLSLDSDDGVSFRIISYSDGSVAFTDDDRYLTSDGENRLFFNDHPTAGGRWYPEKEGDGFRLRCADEKDGKAVYLVYDGSFTAKFDAGSKKSSVFLFFRRTTAEADGQAAFSAADTTVEYERVDRLRSGMRAIVMLESGSRVITTKERSAVNLRAVLDSLQSVLASTATMVNPTSFSEKTPNLFCGFAVIMLAILFVFCGRISLRERICCVLLLLLLSMSMIFKAVDYVWHGLHVPNMLPFRYSFLWSFVAIYMAYRLYLQIFRIRWWHLLMMILPLGVFLYCIVIVHHSAGIIIATLAVTALIGTFLVLYSFRIVRKEIFSLALALCMLAESGLCAGLGVLKVSVTDSKTYPLEKEGSAAVIKTMKELEEDGNDFWRAEVARKYTLNDSALLGYRGISAFSSTVNSRASQFLQSIGMAASVAGNRYSYQEADPFTNLLVGVKYLIDRDGLHVDPAYFEEIDSSGKVLLLKNKAYVPLGFMVNENVLEYRPVDEKGNSFGNQPYDRLNALFREMTGIDTPLFTKFDCHSVDTFGDVEMTSTGLSRFNFMASEANSLKHCVGATFVMPTDGHLCIYSRSLDCADILVSVNGQSLYYYSDKYGYNRYMGEFREGDRITLYYRAASDKAPARVIVLQGAVFRADVFDEGLEKLSASSMITTRITDTEIEGAIQVDEEGLIYFSIPSDEGWKLEVDGVRTKIVSVGGAMIAAHLTPGVHAIRLYYEAPGFNLGLKITIGSMVIFAVLVILALLLRLTRPPIDKVRLTLEDPEGSAGAEQLDQPQPPAAPGPDLSATTTMPPLDPGGAWSEQPEDTMRFEPVTLPGEMPELIPEQTDPAPEDDPDRELTLEEIFPVKDDPALPAEDEEAAEAPAGSDPQIAPPFPAEDEAVETPVGSDPQIAPPFLAEDEEAVEAPVGSDSQIAPPVFLAEDEAVETPVGSDPQIAPPAPAEEEAELPAEEVPAAPVWNEQPAAPVWNEQPAAPAWNDQPAAPVRNDQPAAPVWNDQPAAPAWNDQPAAPAPMWYDQRIPEAPMWNEPAPNAPVWNEQPAPEVPLWQDVPMTGWPAAPQPDGAPAPEAAPQPFPTDPAAPGRPSLEGQDPHFSVPSGLDF